METAKSVHSVCYTVWRRLIDMLDGIEPLARPQSHKDSAEPYKMVARRVAYGLQTGVLQIYKSFRGKQCIGQGGELEG